MGNFNAGQFTKQLHLGAFIPEIDPKLHGIPTMHTEAACASGSLSVLLGAQWVMGGFHDAVLVVGAEQQKTMSSLDGSDVSGRGGGLSHRETGIRRLHVPEIVRPDRADLHREIRRYAGGPRLGRLQELRARALESAGADAGRRPDLRLCVASLGEESERRAAAQRFGLLADHRWRRRRCARFRQVSG